MRIYLIGFMCSGKSTVGRALAALLGLPFTDLDRVAEQRVGPLLPFVQREGEEAFRRVEAEVLAELIDSGAGVIACGGGTPVQGDNMNRLLAAGAVVWIDVPLDVLMPRIERAGGDRPLLFGLRGAALRHRVEALLQERLPVYRRAHVTVEGSGSPAAVAARIAEALRGQLR